MCFRPSAVEKRDVQMATCPTCGMPVAAEEGVTSGTCPYCGDPISSQPPDDYGRVDPAYQNRII